MKVSSFALFALGAVQVVSAVPEPQITAAPSPEEVTRVFEFVKRQNGLPGFDTCGFYAGTAVTCASGRPCGYDTVDAWFGCCSSTSIISGTTRPAACPVVTDCVDYASLNLCSSAANCASNAAIRKCTASASPYCAIFSLVDINLTQYVCATTPYIISLDITQGPGGGGGVFGTSRTGSYPGGSLFSAIPTTGRTAQSSSTTHTIDAFSSTSTSSSSSPSSSPSVSLIISSRNAAAVPTGHARAVEMVAGVMMLAAIV